MIEFPKMKKKSHSFTLHGETIQDDYFWFRDKENSEVIDHLNKENQATEQFFQPLQKLQTEIFEELKGRVPKDDQQPPVQIDNYFYYEREEKGKEYTIYCRKKDSLDGPEEVLLDMNLQADGRDYCNLGSFKVSPNHQLLAFSLDCDGSEKYTVFFKELDSGKLLQDKIEGTYYSLEWSSDNQYVFYTRLNEQQRPDRVFRHQMGSPTDKDLQVYKEDSAEYFVHFGKTTDKKYLAISSAGSITSEFSLIDMDKPTEMPKLFMKRQRGVEYDIDHRDGQYFVLSNNDALNFKMQTCDGLPSDGAKLNEFFAHDEKHYLRDFQVFENYMVIRERVEGLEQLRIYDFKQEASHYIQFEDPTYHVVSDKNPNFKTETFRYSYSSFRCPDKIVQYNMKTKQGKVLKQMEIPSGFDPDQYEVEWIHAAAHDGKKIPMSVYYKKGLKRDGSAGCYLYGYGSYGMGMAGWFTSRTLSLVDRGLVFATAHIRGGDEMGRGWYKDGKFLNKKNTFQDFASCAEHLIQEKYTSKGEVVIAGGSAGGMLVGATVNLKPELFKGLVAHVPFVDVLNTMLDADLPLTQIEFEEWGNPQDREYFDYIRSYSPYDNVEAKDYPPMFVTAGLNDPRVTYWEPAKWIAKLREMKTDSNPILFHVNMGAGHFAKTGRFAALEERAMEYAFVVNLFFR